MITGSNIPQPLMCLFRLLYHLSAGHFFIKNKKQPRYRPWLAATTMLYNKSFLCFRAQTVKWSIMQQESTYSETTANNTFCAAELTWLLSDELATNLNVILLVAICTTD